MTEEQKIEITKTEAIPPKEEVATVSNETIEQINSEIQKTEDATKNDIVSEISRSNEALKAELEAIKKQNDEIRARQAAEAEATRLKAEIEREKNFVNEANQKRIVPQSQNPTAPQTIEEPKKRKLTPKQEWELFHQATVRGQMAAEMVPESMVDDE